jgi:hypothetical protein
MESQVCNFYTDSSCISSVRVVAYHPDGKSKSQVGIYSSFRLDALRSETTRPHFYYLLHFDNCLFHHLGLYVKFSSET